MDVAPNQIASVAASLIPFLEHDDANRALMGSNMMRQAVPIIKPEAPIVGTGLEGVVARDSRTQIVAQKRGEVMFVDATQIQVKYEQTEAEKFVSFDPEITVYNLPIYRKTNQSTTIFLKPIVRKGDKVEAGQILTEGYATQNGELALGRNLKVAFMPWKGYNFEDAIVLSERIIREDIFTSIHVDEYTLDVRETKLGNETFTSDIPNVSEDQTKDLDENGIIRVGAEINPGDILIGKITPKGESDPSPEEKLLKAIFEIKPEMLKMLHLKHILLLPVPLSERNSMQKLPKRPGNAERLTSKARLSRLKMILQEKVLISEIFSWINFVLWSATKQAVVSATYMVLKLLPKANPSLVLLLKGLIMKILTLLNGLQTRTLITRSKSSSIIILLHSRNMTRNLNALSITLQ